MNSTVRATVLVPTHDHGPTLVYSVGSALAQTVEEIEVFIVGDGVSDSGRDVIADLCHRDRRIRFFDNPKGPRRGELHRHAALSEAHGRIVCYLADDNLWLPHHVETMEEILRDAEFGSALCASMQPDGTFSSFLGDVAVPVLRDRMLAGWNFVPLSCGVHSLAAYRQLPFGWRTTPESVPTDLYMWQQFLEQPTVRCRSAGEVTVLHFASWLRSGWTRDELLAELQHWSRRMADERFMEDLSRAAADWFRREAVRRDTEVAWLRASLTFRLRDRVSKLPGVRRLARRAAIARRALRTTR